MNDRLQPSPFCSLPLYLIYRFVDESGGIYLSRFIAQLLKNNASSTFSADLLICSIISWVFIAVDKGDKTLPHILYFITLDLTIGLSAALPPYLYLRERILQKGLR